MTLTRRLLLSYLAIIIVTGTVLTVAADRLLRDRVVEEATLELEREARYFALAAEGRSPGQLDTLVHRLARLTGRRLTIIDRTGALIVDSDFPRSTLPTLENHADRPEFRDALRGRTGTDMRQSTSTGRTELKVAIPIRGGAARVSSPLPQVDAIVGRAEGALLVGLLVALLAGALMATAFAETVAAPLVRLRQGALAIMRGERPALDVRGRGEVGELARALHALDENLSARLRELERERSEMTALIGSMVEGVIAFNAQGNVTMMNPAARALLALGPEEAPLPAGEMFRQRVAREAVAAALKGQTAAGVETTIEERSVLLTAHHLQHGGAVVVIHDVTPLKRLEAVRRDFVANVSHELKTPLTVVRGFAETLLNDDPPAEVRHQFLSSTLDHARRMQRLIDDLLDLSRIESGGWEPKLEPVDIAALAHEVWRSLGGGAAGPAFDVTAGEGAGMVLADPDALRQVLANVLENARRYTPAAGQIRILTARERRGLRIEVRDTGSGIPSAHLPRIFERFYRVDPARSREMGGTGLGLSIVKHLVEAHGGRVAADSRVGSGTTITLFLPDTGLPPVTNA